MINMATTQWKIFHVIKMVLLYTRQPLRNHLYFLKLALLYQSKLFFTTTFVLFYCTYRVSPHRARAYSRPEGQLLTPEVVRLREEKKKEEKKKKLRRYSISVITRDGVQEAGSEQFQKALREDSVHEVHPGWQRLRRMTGVIG